MTSLDKNVVKKNNAKFSLPMLHQKQTLTTSKSFWFLRCIMQKALFYVKIKIKEYFGQVFHMKYLLFSDFLMQKMPSIIKYTWNNSLHFNFLPWKAIFSLINVKFSLMKTLVFLLKPCFSWSKFCNFLLFNRTFLRYSRSKNGLSFLFICCHLVSLFYDILQHYWAKH